MICRLLNTLGSIRLLVIPTNPNANAWNTPHDLPKMDSFGLSGNMHSHTHNGYKMAQLYLGVVNNTNTLFVQQQPPMTSATAIEGSMHNYSSQTIYSQP